MEYIHAPEQGRKVRPSIVDGWHRVAGRIERPPTTKEWRELRRYATRVRMHKLSEKGWFHARSNEERRLSLNSPQLPAIKVMERLGFVLTRAEVARDYFDEPQHLEQLESILVHNQIEPYQRGTYRGRSHATKYSNRGGSRKNFVHYFRSETELHTEYRLRRERLKRHGLKTAIDLTTFDFDEFWCEYLVLREVDFQRFCALQPRQRVRRGQGAVQAMMKNSGLVGRARERTFPLMRLVLDENGYRLLDRSTRPSSGQRARQSTATSDDNWDDIPSRTNGANAETQTPSENDGRW
jgi:hypothetical protein